MRIESLWNVMRNGTSGMCGNWNETAHHNQIVRLRKAIKRQRTKATENRITNPLYSARSSWMLFICFVKQNRATVSLTYSLRFWQTQNGIVDWTHDTKIHMAATPFRLHSIINTGVWWNWDEEEEKTENIVNFNLFIALVFLAFWGNHMVHFG